ncbi:outer membrane beta-barrel domain-containing protein [Pyxidicoccus sp. 3LFB2]
MKLTLRLLLALCLVAPVLGHAQTSEEEEAGDVSEVDKDRMGPLRERVRPVSGHLFLKKGRFEFSPSVSVSLRDAFFSKYIFGGTLTYHPLETVGVSLRLGYAINTVAGAAQLCTFEGEGAEATRGCGSPSLQQLDGLAPGQIKLMGGADVQWAPIYGKLSLLAEKFVSFDLYGVAGASMVQYRGPGVVDATVETVEPKNYMTPGGNLGVGARFFLNRWVTLRTEVRDLIYVEKSRTPGESYLRNQLMFELGVSFFLLNGSES